MNLLSSSLYSVLIIAFSFGFLAFFLMYHNVFNPYAIVLRNSG